MSDPTEIELKLDVALEDLERLMASSAIHNGHRTTQRLVSTYFDTPDIVLRRAGYSLRIRRVRRKRMQTVKVERSNAAGLFVRSEWECAVKGDTPVIDGSASPLSDILSSDDRKNLVNLFVTDVQRAVQTISYQEAQIECAVDTGEIQAGKRHEPICEIELELLGGSPTALFDFARQLDEEIPVRIGVRSKAERGITLAQGNSATSFKATPIPLDRHGDAASALQTIARSCVRQFRLNETRVLATGEAEPLHQARVGIRRLRSAFSLFKPLISDDPRTALLTAELRWLSVELGQIRNLDVLISKVPADVRGQVAAARERAFLHVRTELTSARTRLLMIDLIEWLTLGDWILKPTNMASLRTSVEAFANDVLNRCSRRMDIGDRKIGDLSDKRRHRLRIDAKKLRYATEFFASLCKTKKTRHRHAAFLKALEEMQDCLGDLNDRVTGPALLEALGIHAKLTVSVKRKTLISRAESAHKALLLSDRFWH